MQGIAKRGIVTNARPFLVGAGIGSLSGIVTGEPVAIGLALILVGIVAVPLQSRADRRRAGTRDASVEEGWRAFEREIARARRYDEPMTLARIAVPDSAGAWFTRLDPLLREVDVAWRDAHGIWLVTPETDAAAATLVTDRLMRELPELAAVAQVRSATFPADALTAGALVGQLLAHDERPVRLPVRSGQLGIPVEIGDRQLGEVGGRSGG